MRIKSERGATGIDVAGGLIIFVAASAIIVTLYYQIYMNVAIAKIHEVAIGCVTEIFEQIDLENYDDITDTKVQSLIEQSKINQYFDKSRNHSTITYTIEKYSDEIESAEDIVKKIKITVTYSVNGQEREFKMNKIKIRE